MLKKSGIGVGFIVAVLIASTGYAAPAGPRTTGQAVDDAGLVTRIKTALIKDPATKARDINVEVYKGHVQLAGFVDSPEEKAEAGRVARSIAGVKSLHNNLEVHPGQRTVGEVLDDGTITAKVKAALINDKRTKAFQIDVNTDQGVVQLGGFVDNMTAKHAAAEVAETIAGVKSVRNDLEVKS